jgi:quercetin dioxygenase-like cupin family protein
MSALQLFEHDTGTFADFEARALATGYDEALVREWAAGLVIDTHRHDFAVQARVVRGEVWLSVGGQTHRLGAGRGFTLAQGEPHAERYGADGATFWVARRHGPGAAA